MDRVADIGAGPNFYPSMLISPYVKKKENGGIIELIEYSEPNRVYLKQTLNSDIDETIWKKFQSLMTQEGGNNWTSCFRDAQERGKLTLKSIKKLPKDSYDAVCSFFVSESITDNKEELIFNIHKIINSVKPGGLILIAHMLDSKGYYAGEGTHFPATAITVEELEEFYKNKANVTITKIDSNPEVRDGYEGMAIVIGRRNN